MSKNNNELINVTKRRNVEYLVHFTRVSNLPSILTHGILPNDLQDSKGIKCHRNDNRRLDRTDATCLSVSFPNYKLFYRFRNTFADEKWAVLLLDPALIGTHECAFSYKNAASTEVSVLSLEEMQGVNAFQKMFSETGDSRTRQTMKIAPNEPTDPQAEILVLDAIHPSYIKAIILESTGDVKRVKNCISGKYHSRMYAEHEFFYYSAGRRRYISYFDKRPDFRFWRY